MDDVIFAFAKLAGVLKAASALLKLQWDPGSPRSTLYEQFNPKDAKASLPIGAKCSLLSSATWE
jgi:hypothetical protein